MFFLCCMINTLRQMKKFLVELMNRLPYLTTQHIDGYNELTRVNESIFFFPVFFPDKTLFGLLAFCSLPRDSA